jgi:hypothetical protein
VGTRIVGTRIVGTRIVGTRIVGTRIVGTRIVGTRIVGTRKGRPYHCHRKSPHLLYTIEKTSYLCAVFSKPCRKFEKPEIQKHEVYDDFSSDPPPIPRLFCFQRA